ncbi:MAG: O-antigen ligase family protein [Candidatus Omnitrophica bacterium]|nr:O-antigen ligase family protein [Candidatus Omnitrophota bacterium]
MLSLLNNWIKFSMILFFGLCVGGFFLLFLPLIAVKPLFMMASIIGAALAVVFFVSPESCFLILLLFRSSLDPVLQKTKLSLGGGGDLGFGALLNFLIIFMAVVFCFKRPSVLKRLPLVSVWTSFLLISGLSVTYSVDRMSAIKLFSNFVSYFAVFSIPFLIIDNKKEVRFWTTALTFSFLFPILFSAIGFISGGKVVVEGETRLIGSFTHPNILAFFMILALAVIMYAWRKRHLSLSGPQKMVLILMALLALMELVATKTRNAWVAFWFMTFMFGVIKDRKFIFIAFMVIPLAMLVPSVRERVVEIFTVHRSNLEQGMNSWEWRLTVWRSSWESIRQSPVFGHGLASFVPLSGKFFPSGEEIAAHNTYLQILFEQGVIGLMSFFALLGALWTAVYHVWKKEKLAEYAVVLVYIASFAVVCFADNLLYYLVLNWYFLFFIGLVLRDAQIKKEAGMA